MNLEGIKEFEKKNFFGEDFFDGNFSKKWFTNFGRNYVLEWSS